MNKKTTSYHRYFLPLLFFILSITLYRCDYSYLEGLDDIQDFSLKPVFALPLINSDLSIYDLMDSELVQNTIYVDENDLVWLVYKGNIFTLPANDLISFPDQLNDFTITVNPLDETTIVVQDILFRFENEEKLETIKFLGGNYQLSLVAPELQNDGYFIHADFEILNSQNSLGQPIAGRSELNVPSHINLNGSTLKLDFPSNTLQLRLTLTISGQGTPLQAPYNVRFVQRISNMRYDLVTGSLGDLVFPIGDANIPIDLFRNALLGSIFFETPRINLIAKNTYGVEADVVFTQFMASNKRDETQRLWGTWLLHPWNISPTGQVGQIETSEFEINRSNSNLDDLTSISPDYLSYSAYGITRSNSSQMDFISHDSQINIDAQMYLPMHGRIENFVLQDYQELSFSDIPDDVQWLELNININNGFPLDAILQIYFADQFNNVIDSLFVNDTNRNIFAAASVEESGIVSNASFKNSKELLNKRKIENLKETEYIIFHVRVRTTNQELQQPVKILDHYRMNIQLGVRAQTQIDFENVDQ